MKDLEAQSGKWDKQLRECQYAGEVVIAEEDLVELARNVRQELFSPHGNDPTTQTALLILAINCMYYKHDESGFWFHFCKLLNMEDIYLTREELSKKLERQLIHYGFLEKPGYGSFRYVTPLKEQTGITQREILRFADILISLKDAYGWDGIRILDKSSFAQFISKRLQSGHLQGFLKENSGWDFTRSVARNITQYQRGILTTSALNSLVGYRTNFFDELFKALGRSTEPESYGYVIRPPLPRIVFVPEYLQVALSFGQQYVNKRAYTIGDVAVKDTLIPFETKEYFIDKLSGKRRNSDNEWQQWEIAGWNPQKTPVAMFHIERGYIDFTQGLPFGTYYFLAPHHCPPPKEVQISSEPYIHIPFGDYAAWSIEVHELTDLGFLGIENSVDNQISELIEWADDGEQLSVKLLESVYVSCLPTLKLKRPELFHTSDVGLFLEYRGKTERINVPFDQSSVRLEVSPPGYGRVWVEPISRRREFAGIDTLGELTFIVVPECDISWSNKLYMEIDEPQIILESTFKDITLELDNAIPADKNHRIWRVKPGVTIVEGFLKCDDVMISLAHRIFRASLKKKDDNLDPFILSQDFDNPTQLVATGKPQEDSIVSLLNGCDKVNLGQITFSSAGECHFQTFRFRDALSNFKQPIGLFAIESQGRSVETNTYYLNFEKLHEWMINSDEEEPVWFSLVSKHLNEVITTIRQLRKTSFRELHILDSEIQIPNPIAEYYKLICILASILDNTLLLKSTNENEETIRKSIREQFPGAEQFLKWFNQAQNISRADQIAHDVSAEKLLDDYGKLIWKPPFKRWKELIEKILLYLIALKDVTSLVEEWSNDVEKGYKTKYLSKISNQEFGPDLTVAWIRYRKGSFDGAVNQIKSKIPQMASPIADLAAILLRVCWLRQGYFKSQPEILYQNSNKKLCAAFKELNEIVDFGSNPHAQRLPDISHFSSILKALPISTNDRFVLELFSTNIDFEHPNFRSDWLACWYAFRLAEHAKSKEKVRQLVKILVGLLDTIPASPDKKIITETWEKHF